MLFSMNKWHQYRARCQEVGKELDMLRNEKTNRLDLKSEEVQDHVSAITAILHECSMYMRKCGIKPLTAPWAYDPKDETTHMSSKLFAYGHLLHLI